MLSIKQRALLRLGKEKGYIKTSNLQKIYVNQRYTDVLKFLESSGYLKKDQGNFGTFLLTKKAYSYLESKPVTSIKSKNDLEKIYIILDNLRERITKLEEKVF